MCAVLQNISDKWYTNTETCTALIIKCHKLSVRTNAVGSFDLASIAYDAFDNRNVDGEGFVLHISGRGFIEFGTSIHNDFAGFF